ncbi:hypothetical protein HDA35_003724 [Micromonospora purpureochromogenes]|uniref:Immunity protein Imm1 n=1 Tax=Micromonospora purpureochromogenes TaxID=47872 RepID=A0ABX2RPD1_9ACTN|nr:hypothetical protein [Micromonospora purpureochromogenes]
MNVVWAGTSPTSGRFLLAEIKSTAAELFDRFGELRSRGEGYLEVRMPDRDFPLLTVGFRGEHAVIHLADAPESMSLLEGDNSVPIDEPVEVPVMGDSVEFTGRFVSSVDHACRILQEFVRTSE